jgi:RHS repeat-associated protein
MNGSGVVNTNDHAVSAVGNRFMFQGREYFAELGLMDFRRRFYAPTLGRFLQSDPLGLQTEGVKLSAGQKALFSPGFTAPEAFASSEMNLYRYCGDDPVDNSDPTGLEFDAKYKIKDRTIDAVDRNRKEGFFQKLARLFLRGNSGDNNPANTREKNAGPIPTGAYRIYEKPAGQRLIPGARDYILDPIDTKPNNDEWDARGDGIARNNFRIHQETNGPSRGSAGCIVLDAKSLERFNSFVDKTSSGAAATIFSRNSDGTLDRFEDVRSLGVLTVTP